MNTEAAPRRPLSSLSPAECQTIFALAFGYAPTDVERRPFTLGGYSKLTVRDGSYALTMYQNGTLLAQKQNFPAVFNASDVVGYLAALNIAFGSEQAPKRKLSDLSNDEAYSIFMAAFGQIPEDDIIISPWNTGNCITISDGHLLLTLSEGGQATAHKPHTAYEESIFWPSIKPENLVRCLEGLNVQFGQPNQTGK